MDDTDAFVIMLYWVYKLNIKKAKSIHIKHFDGKFISINTTVEVLGEKYLDIIVANLTIPFKIKLRWAHFNGRFPYHNL